jgi:hypothetical protein
MTDNNPYGGLNTDRRREKIIFGEHIDYDGIAYFAHGDYAVGDPIPPATAQTLLDERYVVPDIGQNAGPGAETLVSAARSYDRRTSEDVEAYLCGYVIPEPRPDARVTFTTLRLESAEEAIPEDVQTDVKTEFEYRPDELCTTNNVVRCWWD